MLRKRQGELTAGPHDASRRPAENAITHRKKTVFMDSGPCPSAQLNI